MTRVAARGRSAAHRSELGGIISRRLQDYFWRSNLPLTMLVFLLPMIILYEVGTHYYASDWVSHTETRVLAFNLLRKFLGLFGATGQYLPCFAIVGILIAWHFARKDKWEFHVGTALLMVVESIMLAVPILALARLVGYVMPLYAADPSWRSGVVLALGAGVYEELVFRLMAFAALDTLLVDLFKMKQRTAMLLIVLTTSILFASYHYWSPQSDVLRWRDFVFRTLSGAYFAGLFLMRGFGLTCGAHASYDIFYFAVRAVAIA